MNYTIFCLLVTFSLFLGMMGFEELGRHIAKRDLADDVDALIGTSVIEGSVFAVLGLLLAFSFSGAGSRLDLRRHLVADETNAIGTAYLRLDMLKPNHRDPLKRLMRSYVDTRIQLYEHAGDDVLRASLMTQGSDQQREIWKQTVRACQEEAGACDLILFPAMNAMIDVTTTRFVATQMHPPIIVFGLIIAVALVCALLAGYSLAANRRRNLVHLVGFALITSVIVYVVLDMEYPRLGLLRIDSIDKVLVELRQRMEG